MKIRIYQQLEGEYNAQKDNKCLCFISLANRYNFQLSFGCTDLRVRWCLARRHGKLSLGMLTVQKDDYTQEMDCHYFGSWLEQRWSECKSVLMCQLNVVVLGMFATFALSFRLVLSIEHEPEINQNSNNRICVLLATRMFPLPWIKSVHFSATGQLLHRFWSNFASTINFTKLFILLI